MFCLSEELINLVCPFFLQLFFLWPFLMDREQRAHGGVWCRLPQTSEYCCAGTAMIAMVGLGAFLFWFSLGGD